MCVDFIELYACAKTSRIFLDSENAHAKGYVCLDFLSRVGTYCILPGLTIHSENMSEIVITGWKLMLH